MDEDTIKAKDPRNENVVGPCGKGWRAYSFLDGHDALVRFYIHTDGRLIVFSRDRVAQADLRDSRTVRCFGIETQPLNSLVRLQFGQEIVASALTDDVAQEILAMLRAEVTRLESDGSIKSLNDMFRIGAMIAAVVGVGTIAGFISGLATNFINGYFA